MTTGLLCTKVTLSGDLTARVDARLHFALVYLLPSPQESALYSETIFTRIASSCSLLYGTGVGAYI